MEKVFKDYPPEEYNYYFTAHSLGSALVSLFLDDYPHIDFAITFNGAVQPSNAIYQNKKNKYYYIDQDFLYNNGGYLMNNLSVLKYNPDGVNSFFEKLRRILLPKTTLLQRRLGAHNLKNFNNRVCNFLYRVVMNINFEETIEKLKKYPLSDQNIKNILNYPTKIYNYLDIQENIYSIDEILDNLFRCIILIPTGSDERSDHWVVMIMQNNNLIEYFDPYGYPSKSIDKKLGAMKECNPQWLKDIIKTSGYKLDSEEEKNIFQQGMILIMRHAGVWCALRITLNKINNKQFGKWIDLIRKIGRRQAQKRKRQKS